MKCCPFLFFLHVEILEHKDMTKSFKKEKGIGKEKNDKYSTQKNQSSLLNGSEKIQSAFNFSFKIFWSSLIFKKWSF